MVGDTNNALYTLDLSTGVATQAGDAVDFGITVSNPAGMAILDDTLYLVATDTDGLFVVDQASGVAARRIGDATEFGVSEGTPSGLAVLDGTLYMIGSTQDALFTLDPLTGEATQVGSSSQFGVSETSPSGLAGHDSKLYMAGATTDALYTLNTSTGAATKVASTGVTAFGFNETKIRGLAYSAGFYATGDDYDALYRMISGKAMRVGSVSIGDSAPRDLAELDGTMYMVGDSANALYEVDTATGAGTRIGTATSFGVSESAPRGLAAQDDKLYMVGTVQDKLYTLNPETGVASRVGSVSRFGLSYSVDARGLASLGGTTLYMIAMYGST